MRPTFYGFEAMQRALQASQTSLDITGQNIANVNTEGYARQRVVLSLVPADNGLYRYARPRGVSVGQGVNIDGVQRLRDEFLDLRYWKNHGQLKAWDVRTAAAVEVENIFDEYSSNGLNVRLNDFYSQLQELSKNPDSIEFATITRSSAQKITETLNQYALQLDDVRGQQVFDLGVICGDINTIAKKIDKLNLQIAHEELGGNTANELRDARDLLLDKLSAYGNIAVETKSDGKISVKLGNDYLVHADNIGQPVNTLSVNDAGNNVTLLWQDGSELTVTRGEIKGYQESLNGLGSFADPTANPPEDGSRGLPYYMKVLDSLAARLAGVFNDLNRDSTGPKPLFRGDASGTITASNITISDQWLSNPGYITTTQSTDPADAGKNDNVLRMLDAMEQPLAITSTFKGTFEEFVAAITSEIAIDVNYNKEMKEAASSVLDAVSNQREAVMGVSLDEEAANMIKFQKAYNAAARFMTVLDEALDTIINKLGVVGR